MRSVPEWIGKTDDTPIPPRVRLRVFDRFHGICHRSGRKIGAGEKWECDHVIALGNGGEHRESNLAPILAGFFHKLKTKEDVALKSKNAKVRAKHLGIKKKGRPMPGSKASGIKMKIGGGWERR